MEIRHRLERVLHFLAAQLRPRTRSTYESRYVESSGAIELEDTGIKLDWKAGLKSSAFGGTGGPEIPQPQLLISAL